ncbi:MAG: (Fe-S)-binding protein [Candidatus Helarchaeota archaeon]
MSTDQYDLKKEKKKAIPLLRDFASKCTACGVCLRNCVFHDYSKKDSRKIMKELKEFLLSKKLDAKLSRKTRKFIWTCGLCEHCLNTCPISEKIPRTPLLILTRAILVIQDKAPFFVRFARKTLFRDINNPTLKNLWPITAKLFVPEWNSPSDPVKKKIRKAIEKARRLPKKGAEICFSGGCGHTWAAPDVVYSTISILEEAGEDFITIGNPEYCCGVVYAVLGYLDLWFEQTHKVMNNYLRLEPRPKKILLHCPGCFTSYNFDLSEYGITLPFSHLTHMSDPMEILNVNEYIYKLIKTSKIKLKESIPMTVTYNDSCSLGRRIAWTGKTVYEAPRDVLNSIPGIKMVELDHVRDDAYCCGLIGTKLLGLGENLSDMIGKDKAYKIQKELFQTMLERGSENLVVPCMGCSIVFEDSARIWAKKLGKKINVYDVQELVNKSMGKHIPRRYLFINNAVSLSLPYIKKDLFKVIPRIFKTHAFKDIFRFLKDTIKYLIKKPS